MYITEISVYPRLDRPDYCAGRTLKQHITLAEARDHLLEAALNHSSAVFVGDPADTITEDVDAKVALWGAVRSDIEHADGNPLMVFAPSGYRYKIGQAPGKPRLVK